MGGSTRTLAALAGDLEAAEPWRRRRALAIVLADMCFGSDAERRIALAFLRRLERAGGGREELDRLVATAAPALRWRLDALRARVPGAVGPLFGIIPEHEAMVLWLWRDDRRHVPIWLIRKRRAILVARGAAVAPGWQPRAGVLEALERAIGRIDARGRVRRTREWTTEIDVEIYRLGRRGIAYAWARAVMAGRCMYYALPLPTPADLSGTCLAAAAHRRAVRPASRRSR